jgi:hypothetical protein
MTTNKNKTTIAPKYTAKKTIAKKTKFISTSSKELHIKIKINPTIE